MQKRHSPRVRNTLVVSICWAFACGPAPLEDLAETQDPLTGAEIGILSEDAQLWRQMGQLSRCGSWSIDEDYSSGRFNVHRWAVDLFAGGPTTIRFERIAGDWQPAIVVGTRSGALIYTGEASSASGSVRAELITSGRNGSTAEVRLETDFSTSVDVYVTGFDALDSRFRDMLPRSARYTLSAGQQCVTCGGTWQSVAAGLSKGAAEIPRQGLQNPTLERALGVRTEPYGTVVDLEGYDFVEGRISHFGGPNDTGVSSTETGAITGERLRSLNDPENPSDEILRDRPEDYYYAAMRFDYTDVGRQLWGTALLFVMNPQTHVAIVVRPVDWGPNTSTGRIIDLSPQALLDLGLQTDDDVLVSFAADGARLGVVH